MSIKESTRGIIIPIGGAENKFTQPTILKKFVKACGKNPHIAIIPTASSLNDTGESYQEIFARLGVEYCPIINPIRRASCDKTVSFMKILDEVDGLFMTGGDQLKLASIINGTKIATKIRQRNEEGMVLAGTSAGASYMSEHMIAGGKTGLTPTTDKAKLATGLGVTETLIIDQHFRQRNRLGRLITATAFNPSSIGIGLDEDTAIFIDSDDKFEVVGTGWVTIVDPQAIEMSTIDSKKTRQQMSIGDIRIHMLANGSKYDLKSAQPILED